MVDIYGNSPSRCQIAFGFSDERMLRKSFFDLAYVDVFQAFVLRRKPFPFQYFINALLRDELIIDAVFYGQLYTAAKPVFGLVVKQRGRYDQVCRNHQ